jgi:hypothetical protein
MAVSEQEGRVTVRMTQVTALVLRAVAAGHCYGFDVMEICALPEGAAFAQEDLWIPLEIALEPDVGSLGLIGAARLAEGATIETANVEILSLLMQFVSSTEPQKNWRPSGPWTSWSESAVIPSTPSR